MHIPLDIYQHISAICPELNLHMVIKGVPVPSQFETAKRMLNGRRVKGKVGRRGHLRYLYSSGNKDAMIDYIKNHRKRYSQWYMLVLRNCEDYLDIMTTFRTLCRIPSSVHYQLLAI